jgi:hypothetical protein
VFWSFREWAAEGMLAGLTDQTTIAQLAGIRYAHDRRGKIVIERRRTPASAASSPDRAEAVVLAFWRQPHASLSGILAATHARGAPAARSPKNLPPFATNASERAIEQAEKLDPRVRARMAQLRGERKGWP